MTEGDRPQDVDRPHKRRRGGPDPETVALLEWYRSTFRDELADVLEELRPQRGDQLTIEGGAERIRPTLEVRRQLVALAALLAKELANGDAGLDVPGPRFETPAASPARRARAPRLTARERASLE
jgi:hypothetical protein